MKNYKALLILLITSLVVTSCFNDNDDIEIRSSAVNDFIWKGMNFIYVYKNNVTNLSDTEFGINAIDDRFGMTADYSNYLNSFESPNALFNSLIYNPQTVDRFSWIVDDYFELERQFQGTTDTNGMEFSIFQSPNSTTQVYGVVRLVLPNSPASNSNLKRGDIFYGIDGNTLTNSNFRTLLNQTTYTLNLGFYNDKNTLETTDDTIDLSNENVNMSKIQLTENPIFKTNIINNGGNNIGYLMYNGFTSGSENELNTVFGTFKSNNINHLVLDLRYNPGGSVATTTFLASMITGQHTGSIFERLVFNDNLQANNLNFNFTNQLQNGATINSLGLQKLYVLTSGRSASASEGLINGLSAYIEVIQIGTNTTGKTQASRTVYDSPDFRRNNINPRHTYAMQPLIAIGVNKNNTAVPSNGIPPFIAYIENQLDYGVLGNENEPMLAIALADINSAITKPSNSKVKTLTAPAIPLMDSNDFNPLKGGMYID